MAIEITHTQLREIREVHSELGDLEKTAREIGQRWGRPISRVQLQKWLRLNEPPMSENQKKIRSATPDECIRELRELAEAYPERVITRNFFRNESHLAESAWTCHFGTFSEFKRQAGITPSRHQHRMELNIAKHAAMDSYRVMTLEKQNWGDAYLKPSGKRFQSVLVGSDVHDVECCPFWRHLFIDTARRLQPDKIVLNGDIFDLPEFGKYTVDPREWDVVGRIKWVHQFLEDLREACPDAEIIFIEGNHEYRLLRHLSEASPAMKAVLSDLHGWTVPALLGLTQYEVNYIAPADLATLTQRDMEAELRRNWALLYDHLVAHHFPEGFKYGLPGWNAHHHSHHVKRGFNPRQGSYEWHQLGAGHKREASYTNGEKWSNGFLIGHVDTERLLTQFEYIDTTADHAVIGGRWYLRREAA